VLQYVCVCTSYYHHHLTIQCTPTPPTPYRPPQDLTELFVRDAAVQLAGPGDVVSARSLVHELDLSVATDADLDFVVNFDLVSDMCIYVYVYVYVYMYMYMYICI
jgi:hypothetical protein